MGAHLVTDYHQVGVPQRPRLAGSWRFSQGMPAAVMTSETGVGVLVAAGHQVAQLLGEQRGAAHRVAADPEEVDVAPAHRSAAAAPAARAGLGWASWRISSTTLAVASGRPRAQLLAAISFQRRVIDDRLQLLEQAGPVALRIGDEHGCAGPNVGDGIVPLMVAGVRVGDQDHGRPMALTSASDEPPARITTRSAQPTRSAASAKKALTSERWPSSGSRAARAASTSCSSSWPH